MKHEHSESHSGPLETAAVPAAPAAAALIFGDRLPTAQQYAELLAGSGVVRGLLGPREAPRLWERHILNCAVLTELIDDDSTVVDVGSGAGLPGLAIAIRRPDLRVTLVEPLLRRVRWLDDVVAALQLSNVTVTRGRAEALWDEIGPADVVTSRAVSALENLAVWSVPLVRPGGWWLPMKGSTVAEEIDQGRDLLAAVGITEIDVVECGSGMLDEPTTVARLRVGTPRRLSKSGLKKTSKQSSTQTSKHGSKQGSNNGAKRRSAQRAGSVGRTGRRPTERGGRPQTPDR